MITVKSILELLDNIAPFEHAEEWDNVGLIVGEGHQKVNQILLALDLTATIIDEAIEKKCNLIITHHPIIFKGIKQINDTHTLGKHLIKLLQNNIAVISTHTNLDQAFEKGINHYIARLYEFKSIVPLTSKHNFGVLGRYDTPIAFYEFMRLSKEIFKIEHVKVVNENHVLINGVQNVAICSGSASDYITDALNAQADVYITSDIKYHEGQAVLGEKLMLADVGHFESEVLFLPELKSMMLGQLSKEHQAMDIYVSEFEKPLFNYY